MRTFKFLCVGVLFFAGSIASGAERPTLIRTCDPRPDILPRPFYDNYVEYRARYNRPRFVMGFLAYETSRTSLEAMSWKENYCEGNYDRHHMPPVYKRYIYPKPWEALNTASRPDFVKVKPNTKRLPTANKNEPDATVSSRKPRVPAEVTQDAAAQTNTVDIVVPAPNLE